MLSNLFHPNPLILFRYTRTFHSRLIVIELISRFIPWFILVSTPGLQSVLELFQYHSNHSLRFHANRNDSRLLEFPLLLFDVPPSSFLPFLYVLARSPICLYLLFLSASLFVFSFPLLFRLSLIVYIFIDLRMYLSSSVAPSVLQPCRICIGRQVGDYLTAFSLFSLFWHLICSCFCLLHTVTLCPPFSLSYLSPSLSLYLFHSLSLSFVYFLLSSDVLIVSP